MPNISLNVQARSQSCQQRSIILQETFRTTKETCETSVRDLSHLKRALLNNDPRGRMQCPP